MVTANILDPIHASLPHSVWDDAGSHKPKLKAAHARWIRTTVERVLSDAGYTHMQDWLSLVLTGSLTTYQYDVHSDCDTSLFVDAEAFPEWSRGEMIGLMVAACDGLILPGTTYQMQMFVVAKGIKKSSLYAPGLRSGWDIDKAEWIEPPDPTRVHDVEHEMHGTYLYAEEQADKMDRLLKYDPERAVMFWHQIHKRRQRDQMAGKGDFAESNIIYKYLANQGLFPAISEASGEYIAKQAWTTLPDKDWTGEQITVADVGDHANGSVVTEVDNLTTYLEDGRILPGDQVVKTAKHIEVHAMPDDTGMVGPNRADTTRALWWDDDADSIYLSKPGGVHTDVLNYFNLPFGGMWQGLAEPGRVNWMGMDKWVPDKDRVVEALRPYFESSDATDEQHPEGAFDFEGF